MKKLAGFIAAFSVFSLAQASDKYIVNSKIYLHEKLIGSPSLIVKPNEEASISISSLYSYTLTVNPIDETSVSVSTSLSIEGQKSTISLPPIFTILGSEATIQAGGQKYSVLIQKQQLTKN